MKNKKVITLPLLFFIFSFLSFGQVSIQLPELPAVKTVPNSWRGYNHGANSNLTLFNNQMFIDSFPKIHPGIIRWPGGNNSQNYNWENDLNTPGKFNLKNVIPYLNLFNVDLQIVSNFGTRSAQEAAEFVNFCNNTNSYYSNLRASLLGNSSPINVKYWEIGNESNTRWAFAWSWLGYQDFIRFRTGDTLKYLTHEEIDRLYYYGGSFFREGWVEIIGGLDIQTAILGDTKNYDTATTTDIIKVKYPKLDVTNQNAVRVYRTPNFDQNWVHSLGTSNEDVQILYDSLTNPSNLLSANEYSWDETKVTLTPNGGIQTNDVILIEYNSIGHDGAFAHRNAMKLADPTIEIGYVVALQPELYNNTTFQQDFATSPPDFMVLHSYPGKITQPFAENGDFSEVAYTAENEISRLIDYQNLWNQRKTSWGISNKIGVAVTEWNINLFDNAPLNHPHRGISSGVYVASFFANLFEKSLDDTIDLRVNNHFALIALGTNFIHLFHSNTSLEFSVQGKATAMVMESIGEQMFPITISNMPQINVVTEIGKEDTITVDAIEKWGGISADNNYVTLLLINRDDVLSHTVNVQIPTSYQADSIFIKKLYGEMNNEIVSSTIQKIKLTTDNHNINLPAFSVTSVKIHIQGSLLDSDNDGIINSNDLCPDTADGITVDINGCTTFPSDNFNIEVISETCPNKNNGEIFISANEMQNYLVSINGIEYNFTDNLLVNNLSPAFYEFCITLSNDIFEQCYTVEIKEGTTISGKSNIISNKVNIEIDKGTAPYTILLNTKELFRTNSSTFSIDIRHGDLIQVKTSIPCEGVYSKTINLLKQVIIYPNPSNNIVEIYLPITQTEVTIELYTSNLELISTKKLTLVNNRIKLNLESMPSGLYFIKINLDKPKIFKILKI